MLKDLARRGRVGCGAEMLSMGIHSIVTCQIHLKTKLADSAGVWWREIRETFLIDVPHICRYTIHKQLALSIACQLSGHGERNSSSTYKYKTSIHDSRKTPIVRPKLAIKAYREIFSGIKLGLCKHCVAPTLRCLVSQMYVRAKTAPLGSARHNGHARKR